MKNNSVSTLKIAATYIGTVVGAGFATGQEVLQFFSAFGANGVGGILLTTAIFAVFGFVIMELGFELQTKSHLEIIRHTGGKLLGTAMDAIITFFLFGSLTAMIAGTGALFSQQFNINPLIGNFSMALITAITAMTGLKGVINSISAVVPFLLVVLVGTCVYSMINASPDIFEQATLNKSELIDNWIFSAILYASYNLVVSVAVLGPLGAQAKNKKAILKGASLGAIGLGGGLLVIFLALSGRITEINFLEVPMMYIATSISPIAQLIFSVILIAEVYTTAVASLFGFAARVTDKERSPRKRKFVIITMSAAAFGASMFGFSNLVKYLYPLVGYGGILLLICLTFNSTRRSKTHNPTFLNSKSFPKL